jgi:hypothetical protein
MKNYHILIFAVTTVSTIACTSTKIVSSWRQPDKKVNIEKLRKVLVVAFLNNELNRHKAEDQMAAYLKDKGIASYNYLKSDFNKNNDNALQRKIKADGFDGAITMRLVDMEKDSIYYPRVSNSYYANYYHSFNGYFYRNFELFATPGLYATTKIYTVEITVFSIKDDKLIWTGVTKSIDPNGIDKMTDQIATVVYKKMKSEGFITKK